MTSITQAPADLPIRVVVGADFSLGLTITENSVAYAWSGAVVATDIYDLAGTVVATDWTFTTGADGVATMSLTDTNTTTLGVGTFRYAVSVTKAAVTTPWFGGQLSVIPTWDGIASSSTATLTISTGPTTTLTITTGGAGVAASVALTDAGGYYQTDNVESAFAQIGARFPARDNAGLCIGIGDSVMLGNDDQANNVQNQSWFAELCRQSGARIRYYRNAGVAGNTSTAMLARFATDVTAYSPSWCIIQGVSPNDSGVVSLATAKANIAAMVAAAQLAGIRVMVASGPPSDNTTTRAFLVAMNAWLEPWANARGLPFLDCYTTLADPADGTYLSTLTADGTHPNVLGCRTLGTALLTSIPSDFIRGPFLTAGLNDAGNLVTNGVFIGDANVDGFADNWSTLGGSLTLKQLVAMSASEGVGNWQELTCNGGLGGCDSAALSGWSVGDVLEFSCKVKAAAATAVVIALRRNSSSNYHALANGVDFSNPAVVRTLHGRLAVPAATTTLVVRLQVNTTAGAVSFGQVTVRNLTTLGVV